MPITINGSTGVSGIVSLNSASANTPIILQDSGSNSNTCRAWVNFNGTGTVAIRASFNVSSITDNGTGDYTVNFTTAMPDANYSFQVSLQRNSTTDKGIMSTGSGTQVASAFRFLTYDIGTANFDVFTANVAVFR
jgi:hypothetical protein